MFSRWKLRFFLLSKKILKSKHPKKMKFAFSSPQTICFLKSKLRKTFVQNCDDDKLQHLQKIGKIGKGEGAISLNKIIIYHKKSHLTTRHIYHTITVYTFDQIEREKYWSQATQLYHQYIYTNHSSINHSLTSRRRSKIK